MQVKSSKSVEAIRGHSRRLKTFPAAKVNFLNHQGDWFTLFLLIDSGASVSVLPKADAPLFGLELKAGKPAAVAGVGTDHLRGWQHTVRARLTHKMVRVKPRHTRL